MWLEGPEFLKKQVVEYKDKPSLNPGQEPTVLLTLLEDQFEPGRKWKQEIATLCQREDVPNSQVATEKLLKQMQEQVWPEGVESFKKGPKRKYNALVKTDTPFLDSKDGLIKGGGRLAAAGLTFGRRYPILIPESALGLSLIHI